MESSINKPAVHPGPSGNPSIPRRRRRFNAKRRCEVAEVRKVGACQNCRRRKVRCYHVLDRGVHNQSPKDVDGIVLDATLAPTTRSNRNAPAFSDTITIANSSATLSYWDGKKSSESQDSLWESFVGLEDLFDDYPFSASSMVPLQTLNSGLQSTPTTQGFGAHFNASPNPIISEAPGVPENIGESSIIEVPGWDIFNMSLQSNMGFGQLGDENNGWAQVNPIPPLPVGYLTAPSTSRDLTATAHPPCVGPWLPLGNSGSQTNC